MSFQKCNQYGKSGASATVPRFLKDALQVVFLEDRRVFKNNYMQIKLLSRGLKYRYVLCTKIIFGQGHYGASVGGGLQHPPYL